VNGLIGARVGSYTVIREVGAGGMGRVYLAEHELIGKQAAIKVLHPRYSSDPEIVNRFFNEARAASRLKHPGVVDVYDFGHTQSGSAFIVMEYLEGETLALGLRQEGQLQPALVVELARQIASTLAVAHDRGIVHRDLKPDNIFLVADSVAPCGLRVKILDFGVAKLTDGSNSGAGTRANAIIGTPKYMSPEQCRGAGHVDHRCDIYSLGCVMFEMITGSPPFVAEGAGDIIAAHLVTPPPTLDATAPAALAKLIARMLIKNPAERVQSMSEVVSALGRVEAPAIDLGTTHLVAKARLPRSAVSDAARSSGGSSTLGGAASEITSLPRGTSAPPSRTRVVAIGASIGVLLAGGIITGSLLRARPSPTTQASPSLSAPVQTAAAHRAAPGEAAAETAAPAPAQLPVPEVEAPKPAEAPQAKRVTLKIDSQPSQADVFRLADGARVGKTPFRSTFAASDGEAVYMLRKKGYRGIEVAVRRDRDTAQVVTLPKMTLKRTKIAPVTPQASPQPATPPAQTINKNTVADPFAN
jgi:serine/threonine-protein kinase